MITFESITSFHPDHAIIINKSPLDALKIDQKMIFLRLYEGEADSSRWLLLAQLDSTLGFGFPSSRLLLKNVANPNPGDVT